MHTKVLYFVLNSKLFAHYFKKKRNKPLGLWPAPKYVRETFSLAIKHFDGLNFKAHRATPQHYVF